MNKLLATLIAGFFAAGAFAQATPATPAKPATPAVAATPAAPAQADAKADVKADAKAAKAEKKEHKKAAKEAKKETKADAKAEVPTKVEVLMDLLGQEIIAGVIKQTVDKTKKNEAGAYEATGETRDENDIDKLFRAKDRMTTAEIRAQAETATFIDTWSNKWTGQTKNKAKGASGTAGAPQAAAGAPAAAKKPTTSLFA